MNRKVFYCITALLVAAALLAPGAAQKGSLAGAAAPLSSGEIKLVAQDMVDLAWEPGKYPHPEEKFKRWELFRGVNPNPVDVIASGEDKNTDFFRNTGLSQDTLYYYRLEIVRCVAPCTLPEHDRRYAIFSDSATTGVFQGSVTRDLTLSGGTYEIGFGNVTSSAVVEVAPGAHLTINGGAVVKPAPGVGSGSLMAKGGWLYIEGASLQDISVTFGDYYDPDLPGEGWVRDTVFLNGSISLYSAGHVLIDSCQGTLNIFADHQAQAAITYNTFEGSIDINRQASALVSYNNLTNANIDVSGYAAAGEPKASAVILGNTITNEYASLGIAVADGASLTLTDNTIQWTGFHGSEASILVAAYNAGTTLVAQRNSLSGGKIFASWGPQVDISDNVLLGGGSAITIGCVVCGTDPQASGSIERNTVQSGWGLEMWPGSQPLNIQHNCIRNNDPGLTVDDAFMTTPLDVRYNYWGSASGPTHPANPGGTGDRIEGDQVLFDPWDSTDSYCRAAPPPPPEIDLSVKQVEMIQVVEGVNKLVEAKPLAVKAVISSGSAIPLPVEVRLDFDGSLTTLFYEYDIKDLHLASRQMYRSASQVTFLEAGEKTLYFFPETAPFGTSASAQVIVDPSNVVVEFDETNNSRLATEPVIKTHWGNDPQDQTLKVLFAPIQPALLVSNLDLIMSVMTFQAGLAASVLPVAPIDYRLQYENTPPEVYSESCPDNNKVSPDAIAKTEYRGFKLAHPEFHYFLLLTHFSWFSDICHDYLHRTNGHKLWINESTPKLIFLENDSEKYKIFESVAGILHSYSIPLTDNGIPVQGGLEVETRRVYNNTDSQIDIYSLTGIYLPYRQYVWLTKEIYQSIVEKVRPTSVQTAAGSPADGLMIVSGVIGQDDQVQFDPLFYLAEGAADATPAGDYAISLLDSSDAVLHSQEFNVSFESMTSEPITQTTFAFALPHFPGVEKVILSKNGAPLGSLQASQHAPQVQVLSPNGGESLSGDQTVTWTGSDLDGDLLTYAVLYSPDGGISWQTLAVDLTGTSLSWDTDLSPGAQGDGRIKVLVSDGFLTGEDLSDGGFSVENKPPVAGIQAPFSGAVVTSGNSLHLEGQALDAEDGMLEGASLRWSSNQDGPLGSGTAVDVVLGYGEHTISLTAVDAQGLSATEQITVAVTVDTDPDLSLNVDEEAGLEPRTVCQAGPLGLQVRNIVADTYAWVEFYDGNPEAGGKLIHAYQIYAPANSLTPVGTFWSPGSPGEHTLYFRISALNTSEPNTQNNQATLAVQVAEGICPAYLPMLERR